MRLEDITLKTTTLNPLQVHDLSKPKENIITQLATDLPAFIKQNKINVVFTKIGIVSNYTLYKIQRKDVNSLVSYLNKLKINNFKRPTCELVNQVKNFYGNIEDEYLYLLYDSEGIVLIDNNDIISE